MAVKTMLSMEQIRALCAPYGIGEVLEAAPIERGSTQTNYLITAQSGKYVLRLYENRTKEQAYFELETLAVLSAKGYPCPKPRVAKGAVLGEWEGKSCALFHFLPGEHAGEWTDGRRLSAARAAAWLVLLLNGFRPETTEHRWNYGPELCERLAREYARRYDRPEKLKWYLEELAQLELPESLPMSVCHADWDLGNILFAGDRVVGLLDFDDANYTYALYDLAAQTEAFRPDFRWDTWRGFAPESEIVELSAAARLAREYQRVRPLLPVEQEHFYDVLRLTILVDCLWYFDRGEGDFYEKRKLDALARMGRKAVREAVFGPPKEEKARPLPRWDRQI